MVAIIIPAFLDIHLAACLKNTIILVFTKYVMLLSHCGEYMANGLTNAVRHEFVMIANDRQTFVCVRKHSRSFYGVSNVMLVSPVANVWRMGLRMPFAINSQ